MKGLVVEIYSEGKDCNKREHIIIPLTISLSNTVRAHFQFFNLGSDFDVDEVSSYNSHVFSFYEKNPTDSEYELIDINDEFGKLPNTELRIHSNQNGFWFNLKDYNNTSSKLSRSISFKNWNF